MSTVLGIDQATSTGYAIVDDTGKLITSGSIKFKGKAGQRFFEFNKWLTNFLAEWTPDYIYYEKPHLRGFASSVSCVGLVAQIMMCAYVTGTPVGSVHTGTLKKFATGYGKASKTAMTCAANEEDSLELATAEDNDEADAIHIAHYGMQEVLNGKQP